MAGAVPLFTLTLDLTTQTTFPVAPNVTWPWSPRSSSYVHLGADTPVDISLDGHVVHATIIPGTAQTGIAITAPQARVWLRAGAAGGTAVVVIATAEGV